MLNASYAVDGSFIEITEPGGRLFDNVSYDEPDPKLFPDADPWEGTWTDNNNDVWNYVTNEKDDSINFIIYNNADKYFSITYDLTSATIINETSYYSIDSVAEETGIPGDDPILEYTGIYYKSDGGTEINSFSASIPCLTDTCNILTPNGYRNVTSLKQGDIVTTSDNRNVPIVKLFKSRAKTNPFVIRAHQYGKNLPIVDTHISDYHVYQIKGKWLMPKDQNLSREPTHTPFYYHLELPNYTTDYLVVNGLITESWDGKLPHEFHPYYWKKSGSNLILTKNKRT